MKTKTAQRTKSRATKVKRRVKPVKPTARMLEIKPARSAEHTRSIPFARPMIGETERAAVFEALESPTLTHGPRVKLFEQAFARYTGASHALATSSCTAALHLAHMFLGIGPGDEVIVPAQTHTATAHAVELCGGRCAFVDSEPVTGNIDIDQIEGCITSRTRAICVVHFLGLPVDMDRVMNIARRHDLFVIEDCALSLGAKFRGVHTGLLGDLGCFSFYPAKHITTAEGGMLITNREDVARTAAMQRAFGIDRNVVADRAAPGQYEVQMLGTNYRLNEIGAAIGLAQIARVDEFLAARRSNFAALASMLAELDEVATLRSSHDEYESSAYCYCLLLKDPVGARRSQIVAHLTSLGVGVSIYYPKPVPQMTYYTDKYGIAPDAYPVASHLSRASIAFPVGPHLNVDDMAYIAESIKDALISVH
jgi:perosamine synthetase